MSSRHHKMFDEEYCWVPTQTEAEMLERYSSVWTEEDWVNRQCYTDFSGERCNAIQLLVRARIHLDTNIYLIHDVDSTFGQVYLAPTPGYKHGIKPTGLANDPLPAKRGTAARLGRPRAGADIVQMLTAAKGRYDAEQAALAVKVDVAYAEACAEVDAKNEKAWHEAGAPPTMAEKLRGVVKPPRPSWEEWQKTAAYTPRPTRAAVQHEVELKPFLEHYNKPCFHHWADDYWMTSEQKRAEAKKDLARSKGQRAAPAGRVMPGTWQHWEVAVLESFIAHRRSMVPY